MNRKKQIVKLSIYGIIVNVILSIFKMIVGFVTNSIAITLDAVNNLSDVMSSVITIVGTFLAGKKPNRKHPFGYGRIEYFTSIIISIIILGAGVTSFKESVLKIINPVKSKYTIVSLVIIFIGVLVKFFFGKFIKKEGKNLNSQTLIASGTDALSDSILSLSTFAGAIISIVFNVNIEPILGIIISIFIIKTSIELLKETVDELIGIRVSPDIIKNIKRIVSKEKEIEGVYDLILHSYGPNTLIGSIHIQVNDEMTAKDIHKLTRKLTEEIYEKYGIIISIGIYASNDTDKECMEIKKELVKITKEYKQILQFHGFYVNKEANYVSFDLIIDFREKDPIRVREEVKEKLENKFKDYKFNIILDTDFSD